MFSLEASNEGRKSFQSLTGYALASALLFERGDIIMQQQKERINRSQTLLSSGDDLVLVTFP